MSRAGAVALAVALAGLLMFLLAHRADVDALGLAMFGVGSLAALLRWDRPSA